MNSEKEKTDRKVYMKEYMREYRKKQKENKDGKMTIEMKDAISVIIDLFNNASKNISKFLDMLEDKHFNAMEILRGAIDE